VSQFEIIINTTGRGAINIGDKINTLIKNKNAKLCHIFATHTSVALMITGIKDANLLLDVEDYFQANVKDNNPKYRHNKEDYFDMSAHIRSILIGEEKTIAVINNRLALGKFQGLFLYENHTGNNARKLIITLI
jgi:secondary thiamine-phosphate synthase enzyme